MEKQTLHYARKFLVFLPKNMKVLVNLRELYWCVNNLSNNKITTFTTRSSSSLFDFRRIRIFRSTQSTDQIWTRLKDSIEMVTQFSRFSGHLTIVSIVIKVTSIAISTTSYNFETLCSLSVLKQNEKQIFFHSRDMLQIIEKISRNVCHFTIIWTKAKVASIMTHTMSYHFVGLSIPYNGTVSAVKRVGRPGGVQMITLTERLTYLKYELLMAYFDWDIQFVSSVLIKCRIMIIHEIFISPFKIIIRFVRKYVSKVEKSFIHTI